MCVVFVCLIQMSLSLYSMVPYYQYLIDGGFGLKILVFSGDEVGVCPTVVTQDWIWDMGYKTTGKRWAPYTVCSMLLCRR
jgi:hypothetical protein